VSHTPETPGKHRDYVEALSTRCCGKSLIEVRWWIWCASARANGINFQACSLQRSHICPVNAFGPQRLGGATVVAQLKSPNSAWNATVQRTGARSSAETSKSSGRIVSATAGFTESGRWFKRGTDSISGASGEGLRRKEPLRFDQRCERVRDAVSRRFEGCQGQFQGQTWGQDGSPVTPKRVVCLRFSPR